MIIQKHTIMTRSRTKQDGHTCTVQSWARSRAWCCAPGLIHRRTATTTSRSTLQRTSAGTYDIVDLLPTFWKTLTTVLHSHTERLKIKVVHVNKVTDYHIICTSLVFNMWFTVTFTCMSMYKILSLYKSNKIHRQQHCSKILSSFYLWYDTSVMLRHRHVLFS